MLIVASRYVRLFLRKTSAWHRINRLGYHSDIADLTAAIDELLRPRNLPLSSGETSVSPGELAPPEGSELGLMYTFADSSEDHIESLEEASSLLKLDELKGLAKEAKVQGRNKAEMLKALRRTSGRQTGLEFAGLQRSESQDSKGALGPNERSVWNESPAKRDPAGANRDDYFVCKILAETGQCVRLSLAPFKLFERVHLVFYRSTEWTEKSLTTIILARIARRNFPSYIVSRSSNIFPSRALLLEFEASLRTQYRIDSILEFNGPPKPADLQIILDIFEQVLPRWRVLLREEQRKEDSIYSTGEGAYLRRLSPAWVYTRIVHKGAYVLGLKPFKRHAREHSVLSELLAQRLFHHARRGGWYQRKALLEEHYMATLTPSQGRSQEEHKKHWKRVGLSTCEQGLQDNLVHIIYHFDLQKRTTKLEKQLKIGKRFQHDFGHARLAKPVECTVHGVQVEKRRKLKPAPPPVFRRESSAGNDSSALGRNTHNNGGKTVWLDPLEGDGECSVEAMCLSHYRSSVGGNWKGYHTEGGLLHTLFALLFHDVLFAYIPNVFQTPFQTCPLDLHTDAFYPARVSEINARLAEIANGAAERIVREVWERETAKKTCIVGLDWGFELEDLREIVRCMGGEGLNVVCRVFCEEYGERGGGLPDLFLWRFDGGDEAPLDGEAGAEKDGTELKRNGVKHSSRPGGECKFVEVKSENDRLSDTQRLWIHVLTGAGFTVELCHALASEVRVREP